MAGNGDDVINLTGLEETITLSAQNATITVINSTISENVAVDDPDDLWDGGGGIYNEGTLHLKNTLIANNTNGDCYNTWGTISTNLNNFIGDGSCNPTFSGDPKLGPLADNGGPTFQRGITRPQGTHCDIGAFEAFPKICQLYGVNDKQLNNSQLFTINADQIQALGELHPQLDIEALDIHPHTDELYAASGDDTAQPGYLYLVDKNTGQLTTIGNIVDDGTLGNRPIDYDYREVDALSFRADGSLWGWAQN